MHKFCCAVAAVLAAAALNSASPAWAAIGATATISTSQATAPYTYSITLHNTGTTNIGSFWFAWNPSGYDFLATAPLSVTPPAGWTDTITNLYPGYDGYGLEFVAGSSLLAPGGTLGGFTFVSNDSPQALKGNSVWYPNPPVTTSYVYQGFPQAAGGPGSPVVTSGVPEPSAVLLGLSAGGGCLILLAAGRFKRQATPL